jgi:hypothetical protein
LAIKLPSNMPMSQQMKYRGYTSENLTEEMLKSMDFSLTGPEPEKEEGEEEEGQGEAEGGEGKGEGEGEGTDTGTKSGKSTGKVQVPTLRKQNTTVN